MKLQNLVLPVLIAQALLLVWMAIKLAGLQGQLNDLTADMAPVDANLQQASKRTEAMRPNYSGLSAVELRTIIRSELDAFAVDVLSGEQKLEAKDSEMPSAPKTNPAELAKLQAEVNGQLDLMHSGAMPTQVELARLEENIARLPPGEREEAIKRMFKAVNQGKVDVTF